MTWPNPRLAAVASIAALACACCVPSAAQAGIFCGDRVEGGTATGETEDAAKNAATAWWSSRAGAIGRGYENWDQASEKSIDCSAGKEGGYACTARAKPCLPDGSVPEGKRLDL